MGAYVNRRGEKNYDTDQVIDGRPDLGYGRDRSFGITYAKRFPPYVFSTSRNACLVHKVAVAELWWWRVARDGHALVRQSRPRMYLRTVCGQTMFTAKGKSRTCVIPAPDAVLCGRCHGEVSSFGPHGKATKAKLSRRAANAKLGCVVEVP